MVWKKIRIFFSLVGAASLAMAALYATRISRFQFTGRYMLPDKGGITSVT